MPPIKKNSLEVSIADSDKSTSLTIFGWCNTRHHESCIFKFAGHQCSCDCHAVFIEQIDESAVES